LRHNTAKQRRSFSNATAVWMHLWGYRSDGVEQRAVQGGVKNFLEKFSMDDKCGHRFHKLLKRADDFLA
jgi:hypothetical protein